MKTTLKEIKNFNAEDITYISFNDMNELRKKEGYFNEIVYSMGTYGVTGCVIQGNNSGKMYKITNRTSAIFMVM